MFVIPAAWPRRRVTHWTLLAHARAIENQCVVIACNTAGTHSGTEMGGHSQVVLPTGEALAIAGLRSRCSAWTSTSRSSTPGGPSFPVLADRRLSRPCALTPGSRAPELRGRRWLNTGGHDLTLAELRGRVVLLDFWTFCCVNCLHVLDELRPVEERFPDELVVIGVHSPKFEHEGDPAAVEAAVERYAVGHAVLDDPELVTWQAYTARAWPTLVVVDPEGYIVASMSGEGHGPGIAGLVEELVEEHAAKGTLRRGNAPYAPPPRPASALRFPGKAALLPDGSFVVSDTAHHQVVQLEADLETERRRWGGPDVLDEPQGVLLLPSEVAAEVGYDLLVADSVNHQVKGISLTDNADSSRRRERDAAAAPGGGRPRARTGPLDTVGPGLVGRPGRRGHGGDPPALGLTLDPDRGARPPRGAGGNDPGGSAGRTG